MTEYVTGDSYTVPLLQIECAQHKLCALDFYISKKSPAGRRGEVLERVQVGFDVPLEVELEGLELVQGVVKVVEGKAVVLGNECILIIAVERRKVV